MNFFNRKGKSMRNKNIYISLVAFILLIVVCFIAVFMGKSKEQIETDENIVVETQIPELISFIESEDNLVKLIGLSPSDLYKSWGTPSGTLSGLYGEIWNINDEYDLVVYYDFETQKVINSALSEHYKSENTSSDLKIEYSNLNVSNTGCEFNLQSIDETKTFETGSFFWLEKETENGWENVKTVIPENEMAWTSELYLISFETSTSFSINWDYFYGVLESGTYRLGKTISYMNENNEYLSENFYIPFSL